jgi:threonine synthase
MNFLTNLTCSRCGRSYDPRQAQTYCHECTAPLLAQYDLEAARDSLQPETIRIGPRGMWRWHALLPVFEASHMLTLGEGDTPLLHMARLGTKLRIPNLYVKDESLNPTSTFKARGLATAVSKALELGLQKVIIPTAGNAGGAMAAYAARAGLQSCVIMPRDTPRANVEECRITGAEVILVDGLISDAARLANDKAEAEGWFDLSTFKEPYRLEGKKVMGFELAEAFHWVLPEVIVYPTGGGTGLVGMWKAFEELERLGWLERTDRPRLVSVQAEGCAPIVKAFESGSPTSEYWVGAHTQASGLRVPKSFADRLILEDIRLSKGLAIAVGDEQMAQAQRLLAATEGLFACPEGAATLAGLIPLIDKGWIQPDERVVLFNTGSGLKYL